jgi:hypothetical protein
MGGTGMIAGDISKKVFLTHHKEHEGLTFDEQNSCTSVRFVAQSFLKGSLKSHQRNSKHFARARRNDAVYIQSYGWKGWRACACNTPASMKDGSGEKTGFH